MIKNNELRIGSLVEADGKKCFVNQLSRNSVQISTNQQFSRTYITYTYSQLSGIILTDSILNDSGFSKTEQSFGIYAIGDKFYLFSNDGKLFFYRLENKMRLEVNTFHQLQNLYLIVAGTELQIDLTN
jgi:hypothetical protein